MSEQVKRVGVTTILLWLIGASLLPIMGYIANNSMNNSIEIPKVVVELRHMVEVQKELVTELRGLKESNQLDHQSIVIMIAEHTYGIKEIKTHCGENLRDIDECKQHVDLWNTLHPLDSVTYEGKFKK